MDDWTLLTAHGMAGRLRAGDTTARELAAAHLERAHATDRGLHAWLSIDDERALAEADAADARLAAARAGGPAAVEALHPLLGIPVALKDLVSVRGGQCTAGSRILEGYRAPFDAHITGRLRDAGAVILGKTNMDEFAMGSSTEHSAFGPTANPWDLGRVPGGSSGGSAASVAAYQVPVAIGTDTGGSIRQPAALCGVVGIRPTYGRVSRYGIVAFASSLDQVGSFGRDVQDAAMLLHAVAGRDERDSTSAPVPVPDDLLALPASDDEAASWLKGKRFGLPREYFVEGMEPGVEARVREGVAALEAAGATVEEVSLPHTDYALAAYYIIAPAEASSNLARYDGVRYGLSVRDAGDYIASYLATRGEGFGAEVKRRIMLGTYALSAGLLRRLLRQGPEGPHADPARLRQPVGGRVRRPGRADLAAGGLAAGRQAGRPGLDVPGRRVHAARQHGGAAGDLGPVRPLGRAAGRDSRSSGLRGRRRRSSVRRAPTRGSRPAPRGARCDPTTSTGWPTRRSWPLGLAPEPEPPIARNRDAVRFRA